MIAVLIALNIIAALFLIGVVLLQSGKGADMGAAFGGASSTVFGASGAGNLLTKLTAGSAAVFMLTSLALAVASTRQHSVFDTISEPAPVSAPAAPTAASDSGSGDGVNAKAATEQSGQQASPAAADEAAPAGGAAAAAGDSPNLGPAGQAGNAPAGGGAASPAASPPAGGAAKAE